MYLYIVIQTAVAVVAAIIIALCTKKTQNVVSTKLDKAGKITNIILIPVYACLAPLYMFLGMISRPAYDGILGVLGWIISVVAASASLFCWLGLGFSVSLRKKGKSKASFAVQFVGAAAIILTLCLFFAFYGNLLKPLN